MTYGAIILIVVFAPELRRSLEQLGTNQFKRFFGISTKSLESKTKEMIYMVVIFVPNTPLHDGALVISENKIAAAACMLPLSDDQAISKELGTRHRAAIRTFKTM